VTWERSPEILWRRTPSHVVALRPGTSDPDILSADARDLWDALQEPADADALEVAIGPSWRSVLDLLQGQGLVRASDAPAGGSAGAPADPPGAVTPPAGVPSDPLVTAMTFWLPGAVEGSGSEPLGAEAWTQLFDRARRERCLGPLGWAVATGALASTPEQREDMERYAILGARRAVAQERDLVEVVDLLGRDGVEVRVLKGSAVAHLDYIDPSFRASADHDLLVRSDAIDRATAILLDAGYERELPERRPGFDRSFAKDITLQRLDRAEVDLHRLPLAGPLGLALDLESLWCCPSTFEVGGRALLALDPTARFCHAAWSLVLTDPDPRLVPALDMVAINMAHGIDPQRLDAIAPPCQGRGAIDLAIEATGRLLGRPDLLPTASHVTTRSEQRAIATYPGMGGSKAAYLLLGAGAIGSWPARLQYLRALVAPSASYRRARRAKHRRPEWRLAARSATRRVRGRGS
jgi:hypothetical protein